ncbi:MAG: hypothetical protein Q8L89_04300 [Gammaproteobacteria bacterium]|nr:hypothetical protein [Gammaproteobacteria bacterium]
MLPIATRLLGQRLREVDAEMNRVMLLKPNNRRTKEWSKDMEQLRSIRRQVMRELEVLDTV